MCGIFGYWDRLRRALPQETLVAMGREIAHRGPDDEGIWHQPARGVAIGNKRLSIIDLAGGHQPFVSDDGQVAVVQNGEIFNYIELAAELRSHGVELKTGSDTEVILRLYEREGIACIRRLNGMFSIAIDDLREDALYLVRDRIGVKPLYVMQAGKGFLFCSEMRPLLDTVPEGDVMLFGELLHRFFALYAEINLFTKLAIVSLPSKQRIEWPRSKAPRAPL